MYLAQFKLLSYLDCYVCILRNLSCFLIWIVTFVSRAILVVFYLDCYVSILRNFSCCYVCISQNLCCLIWIVTFVSRAALGVFNWIVAFVSRAALAVFLFDWNVCILRNYYYYLAVF